MFFYQTISKYIVTSRVVCIFTLFILALCNSNFTDLHEAFMEIELIGCENTWKSHGKKLAHVVMETGKSKFY